jgi:hypothetical protein
MMNLRKIEHDVKKILTKYWKVKTEEDMKKNTEKQS